MSGLTSAWLLVVRGVNPHCVISLGTLDPAARWCPCTFSLLLFCAFFYRLHHSQQQDLCHHLAASSQPLQVLSLPVTTYNVHKRLQAVYIPLPLIVVLS